MFKSDNSRNSARLTPRAMIACACLVATLVTKADILNGNFDNQPTWNNPDWEKRGNVDWMNPPGRNNKAVRVQAGGTLFQRFDCGNDMSPTHICKVDFDYFISDANSTGRADLGNGPGDPNPGHMDLKGKKDDQGRFQWQHGSVMKPECGMKIIAFTCNNGRVFIDNVKSSCVPEPGTYLGIGTALAGFVASRRRRNARSRG